MGILFLVVLVDMLGLTLVIPFLTYFVQDLASAEGIVDTGSRDFWVGIVIATYSLAQFISTPILGSISDRIGRRPVLMFGLAANSLFFIVFGLSGSLAMAIIARFLAGAGNGNIAVAKAAKMTPGQSSWKRLWFKIDGGVLYYHKKSKGSGDDGVRAIKLLLCIRLGLHDRPVLGRGLVRPSHWDRGPFRYPVLVGLPLLAPLPLLKRHVSDSPDAGYIHAPREPAKGIEVRVVEVPDFATGCDLHEHRFGIASTKHIRASQCELPVPSWFHHDAWHFHPVHFDGAREKTAGCSHSSG